MIRRNQESVDLTELTDDEIRHMGTGFLRDLKVVLDKYRPYFITHFYFKILDEVLEFIEKCLEWEDNGLM